MPQGFRNQLEQYHKILNPTVPHLGTGSTSISVHVVALGSKWEVLPILYEAQLNELLSDYEDYTQICTDGLKIGEVPGVAAVFGPRVCNKQQPNHSSVFSAEARALLLASEMAQCQKGAQFM
jgi:hypothetical protein